MALALQQQLPYWSRSTNDGRLTIVSLQQEESTLRRKKP